MWKPLPRPDVRLFLGKGGSGKSTLARHQLRQFSRFVIVDHNGETDYAAMGDVVQDAHDLVSRLQAAGQRPCRLVWRGMVTMGSEAAFAWINRAAWAAGGIVVLWEEVDRYMTAGRMPPEAHQLAHQGRHRGVRIFACARRPHNISRDLSCNATRVMAFRTTEPRDARWFEDVIGEAARQLPSLPDYHCLDWTETAAEVRPTPFT